MEASLGELTLIGLAGGKDGLCNLHVVLPGNSVKPEPMQRRVKSSEYLEQPFDFTMASITEQQQVDSSITTHQQLNCYTVIAQNRAMHFYKRTTKH
jgi:hypothetical protein